MIFAFVIIVQLETNTAGKTLPLLYHALFGHNYFRLRSSQRFEFRRCTYKEHNLQTAGKEIKRFPDPTPGQTISLTPYGVRSKTNGVRTVGDVVSNAV
jgi:hypothetical protein